MGSFLRETSQPEEEPAGRGGVDSHLGGSIWGHHQFGVIWREYSAGGDLGGNSQLAWYNKE